MKYFLVFLGIAIAIQSCNLQKSASSTKDPKGGGSKNSAAMVEMSLPLVQSIQKGDADGLTNIRFHFETDFVLTLANSTGNGVHKVNEDGNAVLISPQIIRFSSKKLGKFIKVYEGNMLKKDGTFELTWDQLLETDGVYTAELGEAILKAEYNDTLVMKIKSDSKVNGKPAVRFLNADYFLPDGYEKIRILAGEEGMGKTREVKGVKTPAQEENSAE